MGLRLEIYQLHGRRRTFGTLSSYENKIRKQKCFAGLNGKRENLGENGVRIPTNVTSLLSK